MNNRVTICQSTTYEKLQKMHYFRPENFSFVQMALIWGQNSNNSLQILVFLQNKHYLCGINQNCAIMELKISMNTVLNFLHSMPLSTSNKRWLADHLYEEVKAEEKAASMGKAKKKLTEKEKDELFYSVAGAWKDDTIGDEVLEAIRIGRQPAGYERKIAYLEEDE